MDKNLIDKINDVEILSQSQIDRMNSSNLAQKNLFEFLTAQVTKVDNQGKKKDDLIEEIQGRVKKEGFENIPWAVVLKLLEIYSANETNSAVPLVNLVKDVVVKQNEKEIAEINARVSKNIGGNQKALPEGDISKEMIADAKEGLETLKNFKDSDFIKKLINSEF